MAQQVQQYAPGTNPDQTKLANYTLLTLMHMDRQKNGHVSLRSMRFWRVKVCRFILSLLYLQVLQLPCLLIAPKSFSGFSSQKHQKSVQHKLTQQQDAALGGCLTELHDNAHVLNKLHSFLPITCFQGWHIKK